MFRITKFVFLRIAICFLLAIVYGLLFLLTFLYGSGWMLNSAKALAVIPSVAVVIILKVFLLTYRPPQWLMAHRIYLGALMIGFCLVGLYLTGFFYKPSGKALDAGSGLLQTGDAVIYYHQSQPDASDAPVVLVLHGGPGSGSYSTRSELCDSLDHHFRMIYFDQRGTGRSSWANNYSLDAYVNDMEALRTSLHIQSWHLLAFSWGAVLANEYALRYPGHVDGVINWGGLINAQDESKEMIRHIISYYRSKNESKNVKEWADLMGQNVPYSRYQTFKIMNKVNRLGLKSVYSNDKTIDEVLKYRKRAMEEWGYTKGECSSNLWVTLATTMQLRLETYDFSQKLPGIKKPYLFMAGRFDPQMSFGTLERYARSMNDASVRIVDSSSHFMDNQNATTKIIREWIQTHPGKQHP